ncbi:MAG: hypothetical protein P8N76_11355 [Pirellulaceae bacterium]|nr:hypothetical protein [Pirellulaceae bacterium]
MIARLVTDVVTGVEVRSVQASGSGDGQTDGTKEKNKTRHKKNSLA